MIDDFVKWPWKENRKYMILWGFVTFVSTPHLFKINIPSIQIQGVCHFMAIVMESDVLKDF